MAELQPMRILDFDAAAEEKWREIKVCSEKPGQIHIALRTDGIYQPLSKHKFLSLRTYSSLHSSWFIGS